MCHIPSLCHDLLLGLTIFKPLLLWEAVLFLVTLLIIIYILILFHCVCFNINIDHTIQVDRTPDSKTEWWKASNE